MRGVNTLAKYMYGPSREFVRFEKRSFFFAFFVQTHDLDRTCPLHVCLLFALQAKSASIGVTKGVGGVNPLKQLFILFKHTNRDKQLTQTLFDCS